tara:strand:+ start:5983 stop:6939 length:957 start_codon:yes stop_codon:yes gene_type:complete
MKALNLTSKLLLSLLTAISFSFATVVPASAQAADEPERYRPQGREIAREISNEFDKAMYEVRTYTPEVNVDEFGAATIFYPLTLSFTKAASAVVFVPGYYGVAEQYDWWGPALASLGIVTMMIDTNSRDDDFQKRVQAHIAAVKFLKDEVANSDSPISGKVDTNKVGIMGHSLGGGSALVAAAELGDEIAAVMPLLPYCCQLNQPLDVDNSKLTVPTLIITATGDTIASPTEHARVMYDSIPDGISKAYIEFAGGDHNLPLNFDTALSYSGSELKNQARFVFSWMQLQVGDDADYAANFSSKAIDELDAEFTAIEINQ